jgi:tetratricopeptide (TPR) repeat protein
VIESICRFRVEEAEIQRKEAEAAVAELLRVPADRRGFFLRNSRRFRTWAVGESLLEASRLAAFDDPAEGESLARLALEVIQDLDHHYYGDQLIDDLQARAWSFLGNAWRLSGDLRRAEEAFQQGARFAERTSDPLEEARFSRLLSSLRKAQRRFDEALLLLEEARSIYRRIGDHLRLAQTLVKLGLLHSDRGYPEEAVAPLHEALEILGVYHDPRTLLSARHNLAYCLAELGRFTEARRLHQQCESDYRRFSDAAIQLKARWLSGLIAMGTGNPDAAEVKLRQVQDSYIRRHQDYDAAVVSMDLALLLSQQGRNQELKELTETVMPIFVSRQIHREALAALHFFKLAVERERVTQSLVRHVLVYLRRSRFEQHLKFEPLLA